MLQILLTILNAILQYAQKLRVKYFFIIITVIIIIFGGAAGIYYIVNDVIEKHEREIIQSKKQKEIQKFQLENEFKEYCRSILLGNGVSTYDVYNMHNTKETIYNLPYQYIQHVFGLWETAPLFDAFIQSPAVINDGADRDVNRMPVFTESIQTDMLEHTRNVCYIYIRKKYAKKWFDTKIKASFSESPYISGDVVKMIGNSITLSELLSLTLYFEYNIKIKYINIEDSELENLLSYSNMLGLCIYNVYPSNAPNELPLFIFTTYMPYHILSPNNPDGTQSDKLKVINCLDEIPYFDELIYWESSCINRFYTALHSTKFRMYINKYEELMQQ